MGGCIICEDIEVYLVVNKVKLVVKVEVFIVVLVFVVGCSEKCVLMICLCKCIVECLLEVKNNMVMLMMFNEVNMKFIMDMCK